MFEDEKDLADKATIAVEKTIHHEGSEDRIGEKGIEFEQVQVEHKHKEI